MCPKFDFHHLCRLAHLEISEKEKKELEPQLRRIVHWVDKLKEFKPRPGEEKIIPEPLFSQSSRQDGTHHGLSSDEALANAPDKKDGFFRVPKVIKSK